MPSNLRVSRRFARLLSVGVALSAAWTGVSVRAQSGSAPVGVVSYNVDANSTISLGVPLLRPGLMTATVGSVAGVTLTLAGTEGTAAVPLADDQSYYIEVVAHIDATTTAMIGQRYEVDEAATKLVTAGRLVLDSTSALNTSAAAGIANLANYRIVIRPHWTLATLFGTGAAAKVNASTAPASADQVLAWNGAGFSVYYLRSGDVAQWRNLATGPANQDGAIVPPGVGVYLTRRAGALTLAVTGEVRTNAFVRPAFGSSQLVAGGFPVESSPADWKLTSGTGLTPGTSPTNADQLLTWTGSAFSQYYLRSATGMEWRNTATGLIDYSNARLFPAAGATLLLLRAPATGATPPPLAQAVPFSL